MATIAASPWGFQGFQYRVFQDKIFYSGSILLGVKYSEVKYSVLKYSCTAVAAASTVDTDGAAACGNDAGQTVVRERLPSGMKLRHQCVSPDGHGVRLGRHPALSRAVAP